MLTERARQVAALVAVSLVVAAATPAQDAAKAKKNPLLKLAEPWPDAEKLRERREDAQARDLFRSRDPLSFTLSADFKAVNKDRDPDSTKRFPGVLSLVGEDGQPRSIPVSLRTRGHSRLVRNCTVVPLQVDFPKGEVKGTAFEKQESLKLVTHCQDSREYEQYVLKEHLTYRLLNLLTPRSFRTRLARVTYLDSTSDKTPVARPAMFLESEGDLARRLEGRIAELPRALFADLDSDALTLMMLFEYMIGNTDHSIYSLHNLRLVQNPARVLLPVPYDFDYSGLVNAPYAIPARLINLKTVLERMYRGPCRTLDELQPFVTTFRAKKDELMAEVDSIPGLDSDSRRQAKAYLKSFYTTIENRKALRSEVIDVCSKNKLGT